ncbi:HAD-IIIC family phosphatase [Acetobacter pasteurianus]|uniref:HAD-IIIC family phosphatase n=1 Tax=Acetobacter pasteurianus TaxID=438 RepID=UPI000384273A|nr:HAD-IIIC family phosphatase [Acetobacter pasteurianus]CCT58816.1 FkbH like protein [Acetobacter pasteurianus 386B]
MNSVNTEINEEGKAWRPKMVDVLVKGTALLQSQPEGNAFKIAIIGSVTTDMIARAVAFGAAAEQTTVKVWQASFGVWRQEILVPSSELYQYQPDIILIAITWRDLVERLPLSLSEEDVKERIASNTAGWRKLWSLLQERIPKCRIIHHLPSYMPVSYLGIAEERLPASFRCQIDFIRQEFLRNNKDIFFLDTTGLVDDAGAYYAAKLPFAQDCLPEYTARFRSVFRQAINRSKKVLVLDLDNTLWGGVIGDDGVEGIVLGEGNAQGEAFSAFQNYIRDLAARGIILAICSKNDRSIAMTGFTHSGSSLNENSFAAIECSWDDKANGIRRIAQTLNIGLDSVVFVDDNPVECALVSENLPMVVSICLGRDPSKFIECVDKGYWFSAQSLSAEDFMRSQAYQARVQAQEALGDSIDFESFLTSLGMIGSVVEANKNDEERLAQMEGKTNQFNLTTRRYKLTDIQKFIKEDDTCILAVRLKDKFGDHGIVSSLIGKIKGNTLRIDSWLMSCRVFSRTLEQFIMNDLLSFCQNRGIENIEGEYIPSTKNKVVSNLYRDLGFIHVSDGIWTLKVSKNKFITHISK